MEDKWKKRTQFYIHPSTDEARVKVVDYLEEKGFTYGELHDREEVVSSFLPVVADIKDKIVRRTGNVTCAACAASQDLIMSEEEFYQVFEELGFGKLEQSN